MTILTIGMPINFAGLVTRPLTLLEPSPWARSPKGQRPGVRVPGSAKTTLFSVNGAAYPSPGQRPGFAPPFHSALKGRPIGSPTHRHIDNSRKGQTLLYGAGKGYALCSESQQRFASKYRLSLPIEEELAAELERRHILDWPEKGGEE